MITLLNSLGAMTFDTPKGFDEVNLRYYASEPDALKEYMRGFAGRAILILEGGADINPALYGEKAKSYTYYSNERDAHEVACYRIAKELGIPFIGNCRGHQLVAALEGGTLYQDLAREFNGGHPGRHRITITEEGEREGFLKLMESNPTGSPYIVNSLHHQGVKDVPPTATVMAYAFDGLVEGLLYDNGITVQWHPEFLGHTDFLQYVVDRFIKAGKNGPKNTDGSGAGITVPTTFGSSVPETVPQL